MLGVEFKISIWILLVHLKPMFASTECQRRSYYN